MSAPKFVHCNSLLTQKPKCSFRNIKIWLHYSPIWYHLLANNAKPLILPVYSPKAHNPLDTLAFGLFLELALLFSPQSFPLVPSPVKGSLQIFKSWLISQAFPDYLSRLVTLITFFLIAFIHCIYPSPNLLILALIVSLKRTEAAQEQGHRSSFSKFLNVKTCGRCSTNAHRMDG